MFKDSFGKKLKIFEIILKYSSPKEDFNKLNINFIKYLHTAIFFTHLHTFFSQTICLRHSGTCKRKRDVCCKSSVKRVRKKSL